MQPFVGIGDIVRHKPWNDHLAGRFDFIVAAKPTTYAKMRLHGADAVLVLNHSATSRWWHGLLGLNYDGAMISSAVADG